MKIPLSRAYFVFWVRENGVDSCLWGDINALFSNLGQFALNTDVFGIYTTTYEARRQWEHQLKKGRPPHD